MQLLAAVLFQTDARVAQSLASALSENFSSVQQVQSLGELRNRIAKNRAGVAILDVEVVPLSEVEHLSHEFPRARIVCTHRVADEAMWAAALRAGAADVCPANDIAGIVRTALGSAGGQRSAAA
jgi:DNA-binding NarL/FixJ family response regulator